mmetsp:Transcript_7765/g.10714  ORF Transcript_7765/g.10714 Transcript_7765/m.10714 type:complete len:107 (+) Transcript_7765:515-835(+)
MYATIIIWYKKVQNCPKPTLQQCIRDLMNLFQHGIFTEQKFKDSVRNSFINTGCAPDNDCTYRKYFANFNKGSLKIIPTGTIAKTEFPSDEYEIDLVNLFEMHFNF